MSELSRKRVIVIVTQGVIKKTTRRSRVHGPQVAPLACLHHRTYLNLYGTTRTLRIVYREQDYHEKKVFTSSLSDKSLSILMFQEAKNKFLIFQSSMGEFLTPTPRTIESR